MPFIETQGSPLCREALQRSRAPSPMHSLLPARSTQALSRLISLTSFRAAMPTGRALGDPDGAQRAFVKVYAFRRSIARRRAAARTITDANCRANGWAGTNVVVYFLEVAPAAAAHAGRLHSDHTN